MNILPSVISRASSLAPLVTLAILSLYVATPAAAEGPAELSEAVLWPERQRSFVQDGPGYLLAPRQLAELARLDSTGREAWIDRFLSQEDLAEGVRRRTALLEHEFLSPFDARGRLLFLHGEPAERDRIDCSTTYKPMEIWTYERAGVPSHVVLYRPAPLLPFQLWSPWDGKAVLYTSEMEYILLQWEELRRRIPAGVRRFDRQFCPRSEFVDQVTGHDGLGRLRRDAPDTRALRSLLDPPADLATWARLAAATPLPAEVARIEVSDVELLFPEREGQRMRTRIRLTLPGDVPLEVAEPGAPEPERETTAEASPGDEAAERRGRRREREPAPGASEDETEEGLEEPEGPVAEHPELRIAVDGVLERDDEVFDEFRVRFRIPADALESGEPLALDLDRKLRPDSQFVLRLRLQDEIGEARGYVARGFQVPRLPREEDARAETIRSAHAIAEELMRERIPGVDTLHLVPPGDEVILTLWRAQALVTGARIERVVFLVDGKRQLVRTRPPFTAELSLAPFPQEMVVRAEGYDAEGELVAADEVVLNQPRGIFRVHIREPARGSAVAETDGRLAVRADVVVPDGRRVERVEFRLNDELQETLATPPWQTDLRLPDPSELAYLSVTARLDDGSRQEDLRILNAPGFVEEVDVELVELFTTVVDRQGRLVRGLPREAFRVFEGKQEQSIVQFDEVEDLPLTLGLVVDVSGSMGTSLPVAVDAARDFVDAILTSRDSCFLVSFADRVRLEMAPTDDPGALALGLEALEASGWTALYDAVVAGLYYFTGHRGRRALVVLTDGEDNASRYDFSGTVEFARRSGVAIYTIGLDPPEGRGLSLGRSWRRLRELAEETGGRFFAISTAAELSGVYDEIEAELRSQYLITYAPAASGERGEFREVEVRVDGGRARTIRGYYR